MVQVFSENYVNLTIKNIFLFMFCYGWNCGVGNITSSSC
jgi:hypothetical protein